MRCQEALRLKHRLSSGMMSNQSLTQKCVVLCYIYPYIFKNTDIVSLFSHYRQHELLNGQLVLFQYVQKCKKIIRSDDREYCCKLEFKQLKQLCLVYRTPSLFQVYDPLGLRHWRTLSDPSCSQSFAVPASQI